MWSPSVKVTIPTQSLYLSEKEMVHFLRKTLKFGKEMMEKFREKNLYSNR